ncbi:MAG: general secretion pathway protein GspK, partial [Polyangiaceae bacterium]
MVLGAIAIMVVMLAEFQDDAGAEFAAATAARDSVQAEYFARSAINLSRLLIASEPVMRAGIAPLFMLMKRSAPQLPVWEYSDRILGAFNDKDASMDFGSLSGLDTSTGKHLGLKGGRFEVQIVDEDAKINVNMGGLNEIAHIRLAKELMSNMAPIQYDPLFLQRDASGNNNDRLSICSAIIDWADPDEQLFSCDLTSAPSSNAVEDAYYQLLPKPYRRKNAPYDSLEELHMVRGVSDDFWSTFVDPDPTNPKKRVLTVWGQGTVNVNSANGPTLFAVTCAGAPTSQLCTDPLQMPLFLAGVMMAQGITMGAPLFGSPTDFVKTIEGQGMLGPMLTLMGVKPVKLQSESEFAKSISTESKVFSIYAVGAVKGYKRETKVRIHTVVD